MSQENWCKEYGAVANAVAHLSNDALKILSKMEEQGTNLSGGLLRAAFEGLNVPDDQQTLFNRLSVAKGKLTGSLLRETAAEVKEERQWKWLVCHSKMGEDKVHPSRSVYHYMDVLSALCELFALYTGIMMCCL